MSEERRNINIEFENYKIKDAFLRTFKQSRTKDDDLYLKKFFQDVDFYYSTLLEYSNLEHLKEENKKLKDGLRVLSQENDNLKREIEKQKNKITDYEEIIGDLKNKLKKSIQQNVNLNEESRAATANFNRANNKERSIKVDIPSQVKNCVEIFNMVSEKYSRICNPAELAGILASKLKLIRKKCKNIDDLFYNKTSSILLGQSDTGEFYVGNINGSYQFILPQLEGNNSYNMIWQRSQSFLYNIKNERNSTNSIITVEKPAIISTEGNVIEKGTIIVR